MPLAHCSIGTSTDRINLLDETGIHVGDWTPVAGAVDPVFSSSALADYRRLKYYREITTQESIEFTVKKPSQDAVIVATQNLRRLCRAAMDYWVESWNNSPVYLAVQASCETNRRYAIIHSAAVPEDNNPFGQPFLQQGNRAVMVQVLVLERGPWLDAAPGTATCIEACAPENYYCWPSHLEFGVSGDNVDCGSDVSIDDLPTDPNGLLAEAWVKADDWGLGTGPGYTFSWIVGKFNYGNGWALYIRSDAGLVGRVEQATTNAVSYSGLDEFTADGEWHHVAMRFMFNIGGDVVRLYIDGSEVSSYALQQTGVGAYQTDAPNIDLVIGDRHAAPGDTWEGDIGWVHIRSAYHPPTYEGRCEIPDPDAQSVGLWITEGEGATTYNRAAPGTADGAITGADWACDCDHSYGRMCGDLEQCFPAYLHFDGVDDGVGCGDYALIQDLPDDGNDMIAEAWVRADGWGENNAGHIISKENDPAYTTGWNFIISMGTGLYCFVNGAGGAAFHGYAGSGTDEFSPDSLWHHVVMAVDSGVGNVADLYLAIDGVWVSSYSTRQQKTGAYGTDVGDDLVIGNRFDTTYTWDGDIAWVRLSDTLRYTPGVNFTPPARCTFPDDLVDADTRALWIYEGHGLLTWNLVGGTYPGYLADAGMWRCDCEYDVDQSTSCLVQPYIANYLKTSGLTHTFFNDASGSTWSANLQFANLPHLMLPPVPAVNDAIYFGVDTTLADTGPFCNLVFDIMTAQADLTGQWEFWHTGGAAWMQLTWIQDNTDADGLMTGETFDTTGIKSAHWIQKNVSFEWAGQDLQVITADPAAPAVTAFWIRWRVTGIGASPSPPWQQNRHIYTISWPYIQIEEEDVPGDIAASMAVELFNESDHDGGVYDPILQTNRLIAGLRSLARGEDFVAYFNAADEQNPPFITCAVNPAPVGGPVQFITDNASATGRMVRYLTLGVADLVCTWTIDADYSDQFFGEYRAFVRVGGIAGVADLACALGVSYGGIGATFALGDWKYNEYIGPPLMIELGRVVIPPTDLISPDENAEIVLGLYADNDSGGAMDLYVYDLILMPVDEWGGDFLGIPGSADFVSGDRSMAVGDWGGKGRYLFIDSVTYPKHDIRAVSKIRTTENFVGLVRNVANRPAVLRDNADQRLWFLCERMSGSDHIANIEISHSVQVYSEAHYLSMRGNR